MSKSVTCFGEILWDVLPAGELPGGAPMNVAYHLHKLGLQTNIITRIGKDDHGERLLALLRSQGVNTNFVQVDNTYHTGLVKATVGENNEVAYDIVAPVAWDHIELRKELPELVSASDYFIFGSLATRNDVSRKTIFTLIESAKTKVLDINLRSPHFTQQGNEQLMLQTNVLKLNEHELKLIAGWYTKASSEEEQMLFLQDKFHLETIVVTKGGDGAILLSAEKFYHQQGNKVQVADTIGSGDAFLAGLLYYLSENKTPEAALSFANKLGAFIATKNGACPPYELYEVKL